MYRGHLQARRITLPDNQVQVDAAPLQLGGYFYLTSVEKACVAGLVPDWVWLNGYEWRWELK